MGVSQNSTEQFEGSSEKGVVPADLAQESQIVNETPPSPRQIHGIKVGTAGLTLAPRPGSARLTACLVGTSRRLAPLGHLPLRTRQHPGRRYHPQAHR